MYFKKKRFNLEKNPYEAKRIYDVKMLQNSLYTAPSHFSQNFRLRK